MKRFYKDVTVAPADDGGWRVLLDGRAIKTAGGRAQILPTSALAAAMADEWIVQGEEIDTTRFILRDMADYAIDVVERDRADAISGLLPYAETDTLCYRAEEGDSLHERQMRLWEPLLAAAEARWNVTFERIGGVIHRPQPAATLARLRDELDACDAFRLAALRNLASLAASLVIGLAAIEPDANAEMLWRAANLEEDWQAELWGHDEEAELHRARRFQTFATAMRFAALARQDAA